VLETNGYSKNSWVYKIGVYKNYDKLRHPEEIYKESKWSYEESPDEFIKNMNITGN